MRWQDVGAESPTSCLKSNISATDGSKRMESTLI